MGEFALVKKHLEDALTQFESSHTVVVPTADGELYTMLADTAAQQRELSALQEYAPKAEQLAAQYGHLLYQAIAHRAQGVAHRLRRDYSQATERLHQALELFQSLGTRWQLGRTFYELGELAQERADGPAAREYFTLALGEFEHMKAGPAAAKVAGILQTLG